jgi:pyruvate/2-oxoglutarate dehydrogenase complex dihydrolipoamide dehydrogenase (E3) component
MDLEKAGIAFNSRGINVDETLRTSATNIYAIGDVAGSYHFSHWAEYQSTIAVPNAVLPLPIKKKVKNELIVWSTFTDPELARAGLTEEEARKKYGDRIRVYRFNYENVDRAKTDITTFGMSKFICDRKGKILGIHIMGAHASDLMHEAQLIRVLGLPFSKIQSMVHAYPTLSDVVRRPAGHFYADKLRDNFFIKLLKKLFSK